MIGGGDMILCSKWEGGREGECRVGGRGILQKGG
jgi:hypothetical protein